MTVIFSDLSGFVSLNERVDPEEVGALLGDLKSQAIQIVESHGGIVNQFVGDEVLALFGTPTAHEDDPSRAVRAAISLHDMVRRFSPHVEDRIGQKLRLHTGINSGLIVTHVGDSRDGRIGITGNTVNIAARLKLQAGQDEIIVGPATQSLIADFFETEALSPVLLKGLADPIRPYRVIGISDVQSRFDAAERKGLTRYTGRERELTVLQACLDRAAAGEGQLVTAVGEAGVGKSRMVYEFRHRLNRSRFTLLEGRCVPYGTTNPYLPFLNALRAGLQIRDDDSAEVSREKVVRGINQLDAGLGKYIPCYLDLLALPMAGPAEPGPAPEIERRDLLETALVESIAAAARVQPLALFLEDWHWSDEASQSTLRRLIELLPRIPVLVVLVYRASEYQLETRDAARVTELNLNPLSRDHTRTMLVSLLAVRALPDALLDLIHDRAAGNPLFVEELCHALRGDGTIAVEGDAVRITRELGEINLPHSVEAVIRSRLDRLEPHPLSTLRLASVIGRFFGLSLLQRLTEADRRMESSMAQLIELELIQQSGPSSNVGYRFKHAMTQLVVYETLLFAQRQALHERVGRAIADLHADRIEEHLETLAFHFEHSNDAGEAAKFHILAARKAARNYSFSAACEYYRMAFKRLEEGGADPQAPASAVQVALQWANAAQGEPAPELLKALRTTMERVRAVDDDPLAARVLRHLGWCHLILGHFSDALQLLGENLERCQRMDSPQALAQARSWLGRAHWAAGQYTQAAELLRAGLAGVDPDEVSVEASLSHAYLSMVLAGIGTFDEAWEAGKRAVVLGRGSGNKGCESFALGALAVIHAAFGNWAEVRRLVRQNTELSTSVGTSLPIAFGRFCLADAEYHTSSPSRGVALMADAIEQTEAKGTTFMDRFHGYVAFCAVRAGLQNQAREHLQRHAATALGGSQGAVYALLAEGLLAGSGPAPVLHIVQQHVQDALALAKELQLRGDRARVHYHYAELLADLGHVDPARAQLELAESLFAQQRMSWWSEQAQALRARLAAC